MEPKNPAYPANLMRKLRIWFSEWGNSFFATDAEKRISKFINYAYLSLNVYVLILLAVSLLAKQIGISRGWIQPDLAANSDWHVVPVHALAAALLAGLLLIKNKLGRVSVANSLASAASLVFFTYLAVCYSAGSAIYLLVIAYLLFPCSLWNSQKRWLTLGQLGAGIVCLPVVIWYPQAHKPLVQFSLVVEPALLAANVSYLVFASLAFGIFFVRTAARSERQFAFEKKMRDQLITTMIPELQRSEKRYSHLVEDAADIIFSLNEQFEFKMVNRTIKKILQYDPASLAGKKLSDLVVSHGEDDLDRQLLDENLQAVMKLKETRNFRISLRGKYNIEPLNMGVSLSYSESEGACEILGKASLLTEDKLNEFLESEKATYVMDNSLVNAEDLSRQLTRHLQKRLDQADLTTLRVALREMLVNAIEHGNLNVTFDEKTQAQLEGRYLEFLRERMLSPEFSQRRVRVEYVLRPDFVGFRITDEGGGFDHNIYVQEAGRENADEVLEHGRGIKMSQNAFDRVQYMNPGNKVILIKKFIGA